MYKNISTAKQTARPCIVFLGNSITHGAGATEQDSSWASVFMRWVQDQEGSPYEPAFTTNFYEGVPYPNTENMDSVKGIFYGAGTGIGPGNAGILTSTGLTSIYFHGIYDYVELNVVPTMVVPFNFIEMKSYIGPLRWRQVKYLNLPSTMLLQLALLRLKTSLLCIIIRW